MARSLKLAVTQERPLRRSGARSASVRVEQTRTVAARIDEVALAATIRSLGWRVYATNQPATLLSLEQTVPA